MGEIMKKRKSSDRRSSDRRIENLAIELERRTHSRRSGFDRREILAAQT
tara:strand:- start:154 stop:300 length:147 start_codon:yes stop_codon:yes gene_type:complete